MNQKLIISLIVLLYLFGCQKPGSDSGQRDFNSSYTGDNLNRLAFPIGGIGAGMFCLEGNGAISHVSVRNHPDVFNEPFMMAAISVKGMENGCQSFGRAGSGLESFW